ncbi:MAG TPA: 3'-5' exonuclease, partial [Bryobacteraceae bacterium]|nr:3'-5' exonuclease [Bryobacteraceae bacterium]
LTRELIRALEARDIAHLVAGSKSFHHREEVETLRVALTAIEWPGDELSVFAALKGSLFAISDELLFLFRHRHGRLYPFHETPAEEPEFAPIVEALAILADLHRARNRRPFAATVNALLEATRAHAGFLLRPGGQQILANVSRVAELARSFETSGGISFRGFVEELTAQAEKEEASEAPVLEQDSDGVRIMTVHSAKGLDFRAVILADPMTGLSRREPEAHIDSGRKLCAVELAGCAPLDLRRNAAQEAARERAEGIRVAYVAATRAKDLLVIPAVGDRPYPPDSWLSPLYKAIYPAFANWRKSKPASGCPNFGPASVVARSQDYGPEEESSVRPGLIQPEAGSHEVVWWDPSKLKLGEEISQTLWHDEVLTRALQPDDGSSLAAYKAWREGREKLLESAAQPQFNVFLASQAADAPPGSPIPVEYISARTAARSASGSRFGTLVHATLRDAPLDADASAISKFAALNGRILGARPAEIETASAAVDAALRHPLLARARAAERCHREYPLVLRMQDGLVLEGVLDLAFLENGEWIVVDFKTDADSPDLRKRYQRQLQWYAFALAQLTATPAKAVLLGV